MGLSPRNSINIIAVEIAMTASASVVASFIGLKIAIQWKSELSFAQITQLTAFLFKEIVQNATNERKAQDSFYSCLSYSYR